MKLSLTSRVSAPDHVLVQELEGEAVLLNLEGKRYYSLDDVGTRMWNMLTTSSAIGDACAALVEEYDVAPERLEQDVLEFVEKLDADGLVQLSDA